MPCLFFFCHYKHFWFFFHPLAEIVFHICHDYCSCSCSYPSIHLYFLHFLLHKSQFSVILERPHILFIVNISLWRSQMSLMWPPWACGVSILCVLTDCAAHNCDHTLWSFYWGFPQIDVSSCELVRWQQWWMGKWRVNHLKNITCCGKFPDLISRAIKTYQLRLVVNYSHVLQLLLIGGRSSQYLMVNNGVNRIQLL